MNETIINIILASICVIWINLDFIRNYKTFWESVKGKDGVLQSSEIAILIWVKLFPIIVLFDLILDLKISSQAWYSVDAVFFILIAGSLGQKYLDKRK